jgi:methionine-rich copper-binding protein CopC
MKTACFFNSNIRKTKKVRSAAFRIRGEFLEPRRLLSGLQASLFSPNNFAADVAVCAQVSAAFNAAIDPATLTENTFQLRDSTNNVVPANITYNDATHVATLAPLFALAGSTAYTASLNGVKDAMGDSMNDTSWSYTTAPVASNPITIENALAGTDSSIWDISGAGDSTLQGFATDISVNVGQTISFKIKDTSLAQYHIEIYRMGYYGGKGARLITTISSSQTLRQTQPAPLTDAATGLVDCGNWAVSASWAVPSNAVSGIYFARLIRDDTGGDSHIMFIVRNDSSNSDLLFKTSDSTWEAYNNYGGNSLYVGGPGTNPGRAYKVSYNRPYNTRAVDDGLGAFNFVFQSEYPMVRFLESNGYNISYFTDVDASRFGSEILEHKAFVSVGHDEYWSNQERTNVEAARDAGVNLAFFSGNSVFKKTRWENSIDTSNTSYRTLVCYKDTHNDTRLDPVTTTGMWMDMRFGPPVSDGGRPQNALTGTLSMVNQAAGYLGTPITVPASYGNMRIWRNTSVASLAPGQTATLGDEVLGYEWDADVDNGFRPAGLIDMSSTDSYVPEMLIDYGSNYKPGWVNHSLTLYKAASGALVFSAGTIQWAWGLDGHHDSNTSTPVPAMQQATINLLADMGAQPATLQAGLVAATASTDTTKPTSTITSPASNLTFARGAPVTITGTAADSGGGVVGGVEVSTDSGKTWHRATGRNNWTYTWMPDDPGTVTILSRATDDSGNTETPGSGISATVVGTSLWNSSVIPQILEYATETSPIELGMKFRSDVAGLVTGVRFYKDWCNTGTHVGNLWSSSGQLLATATFTNESTSGWQVINFSNPVSIAANTTYVVSYHTDVGHFSSDVSYFASSGADNGPLHALAKGVDGDNGVCAYGSTSTFPNQSFNSQNYWVDVIFTPGSDTTPPTVTSHVPAVQATGVSTTAALTATFSESVQTSTIHFTLRDSLNNTVPAALIYNDATHVATLTPNAPLSYLTVYTATVSDAVDQSGLAMTSPVTWSFTTIDTPPPYSSIWDTSTTPGNITWADSAAMEMGVKFRSDLAGYISGIRFYKGPSNTGTHLGNLWSSTGSLLATATFQNESASGWQEVTFATPVAIAANTTYVVSYHTNVGYYSADNNYFSSTGAGNGPLHALANGVDGGNGVYRYSSSSVFPNLSYLASNYWVDTVFTLSAAVPPAVTSHVPSSSATGVSITAALTATFSESVQSSTIGFTLRDAQGNAVTATLAYNDTTHIATLTPNAPLAYSTVYTATVSGAVDQDGLPMASPLSWSFTTIAALPPTVTSHMPATGATGVAIASPITATFSESVQSSTIGFTLRDAQGNAVAATLAYNDTTHIATLTPNAPLAYSTVYTATVSGAVDQDGLPMTSPVSWSFTTVAAPGTSSSIWDASTIPGHITWNDPKAMEMGVKFRSDIAGYITGVRFYKGPQNTGTHIGNLWSSSGTLLARATFQNESATGWQVVTFATPVAIVANTTYVVSYHTNVGYYSADNNYFASSGAGNGPLHALANGVDGGNGVYRYGSSTAFPRSSYLASNYWVDAVFSQTTGATVEVLPAASLSELTQSQDGAIQSSDLVFKETMPAWNANPLSTARFDNRSSLSYSISPLTSVRLDMLSNDELAYSPSLVNKFSPLATVSKLDTRDLALQSLLGEDQYDLLGNQDISELLAVKRTEIQASLIPEVVDEVHALVISSD